METYDMTLAEHMPKSHQKYLEWAPSRIIAWAGKNGPRTEALVSLILESRRHPEQGFRSCMGVMRLAKQLLGGTSRNRLRSCTFSECLFL